MPCYNLMAKYQKTKGVGPCHHVVEPPPSHIAPGSSMSIHLDEMVGNGVIGESGPGVYPVDG
ncbi:hypothetical protein A2U01_0072650, partial [Trifolium medium]|nr:hypothetical protein [Trifolium medium]